MVRPWKSLVAGDDLAAPGEPRDLERRFVGLGTRIAEERAAGAVAEMREQLLGQFDDRLAGIQIRDVAERASCWVTASRTAGCAWPRLLTAIPPRKST